MVDSKDPEQVFTFPLQPRKLSIGRDPACDIRIKGIGVSKLHAFITVGASGIEIEEKGDTSGVVVDDNPVSSTRLKSGSTIIIGVNRLLVHVSDSFISFTRINTMESVLQGEEQNIADILTIGRDTSNHLQLIHPLISRFHATVRKIGPSSFVIDDHGSTNGTYINGKPVRHATIVDGDILHIGPYRFYCDKGVFQQAADLNRISVEARGVSVEKAGRKLLDSVSIAIDPCEFVAILGPSGAGKTTLAHTLMGLTPISEGSILFNGLPVRTFFAAFSASIGFVPQGNILRAELTVKETFLEQCRLRLPKDSIPTEIHDRMREVMDLLDLTSLATRRVGALSGGEAKRVHFGIELLSSPTIIFFDEPFAGLDPGLVRKFMELFRRICDKGHTLLLTTHTLERIDICDRVVFLHKGKITYNGVPSEAVSSCGVNSLSELYEQHFLQQYNEHAENIPMRKKSYFGNPVRALWRAEYKPQRIHGAYQYKIFLVRYLTMCFRDPKNLTLTLLQAPLIAFVLKCGYSGQTDFFPVSFYFCLSISAIWMGGVNSIREIAREWTIIEREFRVGVSHGAYIASKISVFSLVAGIQGVVFSYSLKAFFYDLNVTPSLIALLSAGCISGTLVGLFISVFSKNVAMAISWLPIVFIPQIFFSGILMPFDEMPVIGQLASNLTVSRPVFSLLKKKCLLNQSLWQWPEWNALFCLCTGLIIFMFLGVKFKRYTLE